MGVGEAKWVWVAAPCPEVGGASWLPQGWLRVLLGQWFCQDKTSFVRGVASLSTLHTPGRT